MLLPPVATDVTAIADPFGNSYGYSTANQVNPELTQDTIPLSISGARQAND